jgi:aspartate/glutamate racemase
MEASLMSVAKARIALIHTTPLVLPAVEKAMEPLKGQYEFFHMLDEAVLYRMMKDGNSEELSVPWLKDVVDKAVRAEAGAAIVTCSSWSPAAVSVNRESDIPVLRVDEMMYRRVLGGCSNPAVLMTNPTNETPADLIARETEELLGLSAKTPLHVCSGAFKALQAGDGDAHDREVVAETIGLLETHDGIIYSQISMARVRDLLPGDLKERVHVSLDYLGEMLEDIVIS